MRKTFLLLVTLLLLLAVPALSLAESYNPVEIGKEVDDFEVELLDGTIFKLSEQRGKVVFVNIWATWCPPCVGELPDIQKLADDYPDKLVVLGLNCGEDKDTVQAFLDTNGYTFPVALDESYTLINGIFPTEYIPFSVFIDANGAATTMHIGAGDYDTFVKYLEEAPSAAPIEEVPAE